MAALDRAEASRSEPGVVSALPERPAPLGAAARPAHRPPAPSLIPPFTPVLPFHPVRSADPSCPKSSSRSTRRRYFTEQQIVGHNRWHPDIPAKVQVKPGDSFRVHCREWFDGAIHNDDSADDILNAPLAGVHVLSGPISVQGAEPGDLLIVDILDVGPIPQEDSGPLAGQGWGYTGVFATRNGGGFLTEQFPDAYKVIWDFTGGRRRRRGTCRGCRSPASCTRA